MHNLSSQVIVYVTYQGTADSRFDRRYYTEHHLPLVMRAWQQYGLESVSAFFPADSQPGTLAICECIFRDEQAVQQAFNAEDVMGVMQDVAQFTDLIPARIRGVSL